MIYSLNASRQASTILLANTDQVADHCYKIDLALTNIAQGAFLPVRERDLFLLDPQPTVLRELDPSYQGPIFLDSSFEEPDLESIMGDSVPEDIKSRVLIAARVPQQEPGEGANPGLKNQESLHHAIWSGHCLGMAGCRVLSIFVNSLF